MTLDPQAISPGRNEDLEICIQLSESPGFLKADLQDLKRNNTARAIKYQTEELYHVEDHIDLDQDSPITIEIQDPNPNTDLTSQE